MTYGYPQSRMEALTIGADRYVGKECYACRGNIRYLSNGACVHCQLERSRVQDGKIPVERGSGDPERANNAAERRKAQDLGVTTYERISPCPKCMKEGRGFTNLRYTSNGCCVACLKAKSDETYRRNAGYMFNAALPILPAAKACHHGAEIARILPELGGKTLTFVKHPWGAEMTGEKPHYGKCIFCHPSRAISLYNKIAREGGVPVELRQVATWLTVSMRPAEGYPRGYLSHCMASFNSVHQRGGVAQPVPVPLPLPNPIEQQMEENLKNIFNDD